VQRIAYRITIVLTLSLADRMSRIVLRDSIHTPIRFASFGKRNSLKDKAEKYKKIKILNSTVHAAA